MKVKISISENRAKNGFIAQVKDLSLSSEGRTSDEAVEKVKSILRPIISSNDTIDPFTHSTVFE